MFRLFIFVIEIDVCNCIREFSRFSQVNNYCNRLCSLLLVLYDWVFLFCTLDRCFRLELTKFCQPIELVNHFKFYVHIVLFST